MEPKYLAGKNDAWDAAAREWSHSGTYYARMAQNFEAMNEPQLRVDWYLRAIQWARVAVVLVAVAAAGWLAVRGIEKAAWDAAHYGEPR